MVTIQEVLERRSIQRPTGASILASGRRSARSRPSVSGFVKRLFTGSLSSPSRRVVMGTLPIGAAGAPSVLSGIKNIFSKGATALGAAPSGGIVGIGTRFTRGLAVATGVGAVGAAVSSKISGRPIQFDLFSGPTIVGAAGYGVGGLPGLAIGTGIGALRGSYTRGSDVIRGFTPQNLPSPNFGPDIAIPDAPNFFAGDTNVSVDMGSPLGPQQGTITTFSPSIVAGGGQDMSPLLLAILASAGGGYLLGRRRRKKKKKKQKNKKRRY